MKPTQCVDGLCFEIPRIKKEIQVLINRASDLRDGEPVEKAMLQPVICDLSAARNHLTEAERICKQILNMKAGEKNE